MRLNRTVSLLLLILAVGALFRFTLLNTVPPGIHPDAAADGLDAWQAYQTHHHPVFYPSNFGREGLFINLISYSFQLFGPTVVALKLPGCIFGLLSVLGMYFFGYEATRKKSVGLLASFFTAISFWLVMFDRMGFRAALSVTAVVWTSFFFLRALRLNRGYDYALTGICVGIGLNSYPSFRLLPIALLAVFLGKIGLDRQARQVSWWQLLKQRQAFGWTIVVSVALTAPLALYFFHHPADFSARSSEVSVFDQPHPLKLLAESIGANLVSYNFFGDPNWRHNFSTLPLLDTFEGLLFLVGLSIIVRRVTRPATTPDNAGDNARINGAYVLIMLVLMFIPAAVTYSPGGIPHALRLIDTAPAVYLMVAIALAAGVEKVNNLWPDHRRLISQSLRLVLVYVLLYNGTLYFGRWGFNRQVAHEYGQDYSRLAQLIRTESQHGKSIYLIQNSSEVDFLTLQVPHVLKVHWYDQASFERFQPDVVVFSNFRPQDTAGLVTLRHQGWRLDASETLGQGGHDIKVLQP